MIFGRKKPVYISGTILHRHKKPKPLWKCKTVKLVCFATIQSTRSGLLHFLQWTSTASWFKSRISKLRGFVILFWRGRRGGLKRPWFTWQVLPLRRPEEQISWRCFTRHLFSFSTTRDIDRQCAGSGHPGTRGWIVNKWTTKDYIWCRRIKTACSRAWWGFAISFKTM